jgi:hypothetical protein
MEQNTMLREDMLEEQFSDLGSSDLIICRNRDKLLACTINYVEDGGMTVRGG